MKNILKYMKKHWTRVWLIAVLLLSCGAAITYAAYTEVSVVKRVVSTKDSEGELFSSNCMRQTISSRMLSSTSEYSVTVCNYDQEKPLTFSPAQITYDFYAQLQVKYEDGTYMTMSQLLTALQTDYPEDYNTRYQTYVAKIGENYSIRKQEDDTGVAVSAADGAEHFFRDYGSTDYKISFANEALAPNKSSTDRFQVKVAAEDLLKDDPDFYIHIWAEPSGSLHQIDARIYGGKGTTTTASWTGTLRETDCATVDYDFYNYIITGNGAGTVDILWNDSYFEINEFFFSELSENSFVQNPVEPETISSGDDKYGSSSYDGKYVGWKKISLIVDSLNDKNRYELQLYKKQANKKYIDDNAASKYIDCYFTDH